MKYPLRLQLLATMGMFMLASGRCESADELPSANEVRSAQAFISIYKTPYGGAAVVRRGRAQIPVEAGMKLYLGDVVEIVSGEPILIIDPFQGNARIQLSSRLYYYRIARDIPQSAAPPPQWVRQLFTPSELINSSPTVARGEEEFTDPTPIPACNGARGTASVPQMVDQARNEMTVLWGEIPVRRLNLRRADRSSLRTLAVSGANAEIRLQPSDIQELASIVFEDRDGTPLRQAFVRFTTYNVAKSYDDMLSEAYNVLNSNCLRQDPKAMESMSRIAELRTVFPVATVIYRALARGRIQW